MGIAKKQRNMTFLTITKGEMIMRVKEPTDTSKSRVIEKGEKAGTTVYEEHYDYMDGKIISIDKVSRKVSFQPDPLVQMEIIIKDEEGDTFQLSFPYSSNYSNGLITRIESVNLSKPVEINTYWIKGEDGKERGFLAISQDGQKIAPNYARNDGKMPSVEKVPIGKTGKFAYDDTDLLAFYDEIIAKVQPNFSSPPEQVIKDEPIDHDENNEAGLTSGDKKF